MKDELKGHNQVIKKVYQCKKIYLDKLESIDGIVKLFTIKQCIYLFKELE